MTDRRHRRGCPLFTHPTQRGPNHPTHCTCPDPTGDTARVVQFLREHPGSSVMDIRFALFISNVTARMSDAREAGVKFVKWRDDNGVYRYRVVDSRPVTVGTQEMLAL